MSISALGTQLSPLRFVVVGAGKMGQAHVACLERDPRCQVVGLVDSRDVVHQGYPRFLTPETIDVAFDCAVVATPSNTRLAVLAPLLARGAAVLVEKPLATRVDECRAIIDLARHAGRLVKVGFVERFNPVTTALNTLLGSGFLGDDLRFEFIRRGPAPHGPASGLQSAQDRYGGVVVDLASHDIDLFGWLTGASSLVSGSVQRSESSQGSSWSFALQSGSSQAVIAVGWGDMLRERSIRVVGTKGEFCGNLLSRTSRWRAFGNRDALAGGWHDGSVSLDTIDDNARGGTLAKLVESEFQRTNPLAQQLAAFVDALHSRSSAICDVAEAAATAAIVEQVLASTA